MYSITFFIHQLGGFSKAINGTIVALLGAAVSIYFTRMTAREI